MIFDFTLARLFLDSYDRRLLTADELLQRLASCLTVAPAPEEDTGSTTWTSTVPEVSPRLYERLMRRPTADGLDRS